MLDLFERDEPSCSHVWTETSFPFGLKRHANTPPSVVSDYASELSRARVGGCGDASINLTFVGIYSAMRKSHTSEGTLRILSCQSAVI